MDKTNTIGASTGDNNPTSSQLRKPPQYTSNTINYSNLKQRYSPLLGAKHSKEVTVPLNLSNHTKSLSTDITRRLYKQTINKQHPQPITLEGSRTSKSSKEANNTQLPVDISSLVPSASLKPDVVISHRRPAPVSGFGQSRTTPTKSVDRPVPERLRRVLDSQEGKHTSDELSQIVRDMHQDRSRSRLSTTSSLWSRDSSWDSGHGPPASGGNQSYRASPSNSFSGDPFSTSGINSRGSEGGGSSQGNRSINVNRKRNEQAQKKLNASLDGRGSSETYKREQEEYRRWYTYMRMYQNFVTSPAGRAAHAASMAQYAQFYSGPGSTESLPTGPHQTIRSGDFVDKQPGSKRDMEGTSGRLTPHLFMCPHSRCSIVTLSTMITLTPTFDPSPTSQSSKSSTRVQLLDASSPPLSTLPWPLHLESRTSRTAARDYLAQQRSLLRSQTGVQFIDNLGAALLIDYLDCLIENNGDISDSTLSGLLVSIFERVCPSGSLDQSVFKQQVHPPSQHLPSTANPSEQMERFRLLLMRGRRDEAIDFACSRGLWSFAFSLVTAPQDASLAQRLVSSFLRRNVFPSDPIYTFHQIMDGELPRAVEVIDPECPSNWLSHLAVIIANRSQINPKLFTQAIDRLTATLRGNRRILSAQFCALITHGPQSFLNNSPINESGSAKEAAKHCLGQFLLGDETLLTSVKGRSAMDQLAKANLKTTVGQMAFYWTHIYEYAMSLKDNAFVLPHLQELTLNLALNLIDVGNSVQGLAYCLSSSRHVALSPNLYTLSFIRGLITLTERIYCITSDKPEFEGECNNSFGEDLSAVDSLRNWYQRKIFSSDSRIPLPPITNFQYKLPTEEHHNFKNSNWNHLQHSNTTRNCITAQDDLSSNNYQRYLSSNPLVESSSNPLINISKISSIPVTTDANLSLRHTHFQKRPPGPMKAMQPYPNTTIVDFYFQRSAVESGPLIPPRPLLPSPTPKEFDGINGRRTPVRRPNLPQFVQQPSLVSSSSSSLSLMSLPPFASEIHDSQYVANDMSIPSRDTIPKTAFPNDNGDRITPEVNVYDDGFC